MSVSPVRLGGHRPRRRVQHREQAGRAVTGVAAGHPLGCARHQWQYRGGAVGGLYLGFVRDEAPCLFLDGGGGPSSLPWRSRMVKLAAA